MADLLFALLESGADPNERRFGDDFTVLMLAASEGDDNALEIILKDSRTNIDLHDSSGRTAIMYAIINNHVACVKALLDADADVTVSNNDEPSPG